MTEKLCPGLGETQHYEVSSCGLKPAEDFLPDSALCREHRDKVRRRYELLRDGVAVTP